MSNKTILLFDIGNTNVKVGIATHEEVVTSYSLPTSGSQTGDSLGLALLDILRHAHLAPCDILACVGSSVVPSLEPLLRHACERYVHQPLYLAAREIPIPMENRYERPMEVGADRLVAAFAAHRLYPEAPALISVDFGTATTFDCVREDAYLGGLICPGLLSSAGALSARTAKLPSITLHVESNTPVLGRSTTTSLNHGFIFGFAAMTEGIVERLRHVMARDAQAEQAKQVGQAGQADKDKSPLAPQDILIVGSGGFAKAIARVSSCFDHVRTDLILEGLRILYTENTALFHQSVTQK